MEAVRWWLLLLTLVWAENEKCEQGVDPTPPVVNNNNLSVYLPHLVPSGTSAALVKVSFI